MYINIVKPTPCSNCSTVLTENTTAYLTAKKTIICYNCMLNDQRDRNKPIDLGNLPITPYQPLSGHKYTLINDFTLPHTKIDITS